MSDLHSVLRQVWNRDLSADDGLDELDWMPAEIKELEAEVKEHESRREAMQLCIDTRDAEIARLRAENRMLRQLAKADAMASVKIVSSDTAGGE